MTTAATSGSPSAVSASTARTPCAVRRGHRLRRRPVHVHHVGELPSRHAPTMLVTWTFAIRPSPSNAIPYIRPISPLRIVRSRLFAPSRLAAAAEPSPCHDRRPLESS